MKTILTHDGMFHADDVFAVAAMMLIFPDSKVVRSRDPEEQANADIVVDVGGLYDPKFMQFDHHQEGGAGERPNGIPYASFGLVWKEFGEKLAGFDGAKYIDKRLVSPIDALDNGVSLSVPKFDNIREYNISDFFHSFVDYSLVNEEYLHAVFMQMVGMATALLDRETRNAREYEKDLEHVRKLVSNISDKRIIVLDEDLPWKEVIVPIHESTYVIYPRNDGKWSVKAVPKVVEGFEVKRPFPESWAGKTGGELAELSGVDDIVFCHNKRFITVTSTKESALKVAEIALNS
jgi:uncharacterized UPF0160 family protein